MDVWVLPAGNAMLPIRQHWLVKDNARARHRHRPFGDGNLFAGLRRQAAPWTKDIGAPSRAQHSWLGQRSMRSGPGTIPGCPVITPSKKGRADDAGQGAGDYRR